MSELKDQSFKLGSRVVTVVDFFNSDFLEKLRKKYPSAGEAEFWIALRELIRYLHLTCYAPHGLFFPGTRLMDDLWHSLITETKEYQTFCHKLRPGSFIHHSGIKYDDYTTKIGSQQIHVEEASWLTSYINAFGKIDEHAFECLLMAKAIAKNINFSLAELNNYGQVLIQLSESELNNLPKNFDQYLKTEVITNAQFISEERGLTKLHLRHLLHLCQGSSSLPIMLTPDELEKLYGASTALAFCTAQHLAAVERLSGLQDWQKSNPKLWEI